MQNTHRQHALDIPPLAPRPIAQVPLSRPVTWQEHLKFWAGMITAWALAMAVIFGGAYWFNGGRPEATPVAHAQVVTDDLPPLDEVRAGRLAERLRDWRAGYEAAVQNGCRIQPMLDTPLARRP
jgi:hypothetical protein